MKFREAQKLETFLHEVKALALRQTIAIEKIAASLSKIDNTIRLTFDQAKGALKMRDVDRAQVYGEHLGKRLRT